MQLLPAIGEQFFESIVQVEGIESEVPPQVYTQLTNDRFRDVYLTVRTAAQPGAVARAVEADGRSRSHDSHG